MNEGQKKDPFLAGINAVIVFILSFATFVGIGTVSGLLELYNLGDIWHNLYYLYFLLTAFTSFLFALIVFITTYYNNVW